jgi:hydroxymethylbilane synthase
MISATIPKTEGLIIRRVVRIGTRGSRLALAQARWVSAALEARWPGLRPELVTIVTSGDRLGGSLAGSGGKGLFIKEIEEALLAEHVDCAVHSMKDLPVSVAPGLVVAAVPERADPRDVLVGPPGCRSLGELPPRARVGTASLRRRAQLLAARSDLAIAELRGNVDTRLRKQAEGAYDGVVVAAAGLARLGISAAGGAYMDPEGFVPAVGQGALALEAREADGEMRRLLAALNDAAAERAVGAERAFLRVLGGDCATPIAAHAQQHGGSLRLIGLVATPDGTKVLRATVSGPSGEIEELGKALAVELQARGADDILANVRAEHLRSAGQGAPGGQATGSGSSRG